MENVNENRINSFDFLRALAISYIVIIRHMDDYASNSFGGIVNTILTYIFLGIFVYLSGYLLTSKYSVLNNIDFSFFTS
jgi:peptidoglycan/LPS O-acetylase OafA/YrhL